MKRDKHISVALETKTYQCLQELADRNGTPVGRLVRQIIKMYMRGIDDGIFCRAVNRLPNTCPKTAAVPDTGQK